MGKNPCPLCATPGMIICASGWIKCNGCGETKTRRVFEYLMRKKHIQVSFMYATGKYEAVKRKISFGEWLIRNDYELYGKP